MGNLVGKQHNETSKRRKKNGKRSNRDRHQHHKHERRRQHENHEGYPRSRLSTLPDARDYNFTKHFSPGYDPYYYPPPAHWHRSYGWPGIPPGSETHRPSTGASLVSNNLPCTCHARFGTNSRCPASVSSSIVSPTGRNHNRIRPTSGSRLRYRSSRLNRRTEKSLSCHDNDESSKIRGMVVYKNRNEEKLKMLGEDEENVSIKTELDPHENDENKSAFHLVSATIKPSPIENGKDESSRINNVSERRKTKVIKSSIVEPSPLVYQFSEAPVEIAKRTMIDKFWDSPLGKKLPIGGPLTWFRRPRVLHPVSENEVENPSAIPVAVKSKQRSLWSGIKHRFLWKNVSRKRASSSCNSNPVEDVADMSPRNASVEPTPRCPTRHAQSRQYVWKTASSPMSHVVDDDIEIIEFLPRNQSFESQHDQHQKQHVSEQEEVILPNMQKCQRSPFFASKYTWRSSNTNVTKQTWGQSEAWKNNHYHNTGENRSGNNSRLTRNYLWQRNNVVNTNGRPCFEEENESMLYHH